MDVDIFSFLMEIASSFYSFFMRVATCLQATPDWYLSENAVTTNYLLSFYNIFSQVREIFSFPNGGVLKAVMLWLQTIGFGNKPVWVLVLLIVGQCFVWFALLKFIKNLLIDVT